MIRFLSGEFKLFFFTVSGKSIPVSDLSQNEVGEVPHEALARDCHHRDEERDSGKTKTVHSLWKFGFLTTLILQDIIIGKGIFIITRPALSLIWMDNINWIS